MSVLYTKTTPKGIDIIIQALQTHLYNELASTWDTTSYNSYGRCYKNESSEGVIPEVFIGTNDYNPLLDVDKVNAFSFFVCGDDIDYEEGLYTVEVGLIFFFNLKNLKSSITHRADEEARIDVLLLLEEYPSFEIIGVQTGYDNVFAEFNTDLIKLDDIQPYHCFRVNGLMRYSAKDKC